MYDLPEVDVLIQSDTTRRDVLLAGAVSAATLFSGCATNPVSGSSQLMLVSPEQEIAMDRQSSPHQFSADYGESSDRRLANYVDGLGKNMGKKTHRPNMPYSFRPVDATYINAYTFPGGSVAITRGILLEIDNEAELSALIGHELGHVNARHMASRMSKGMLAQVAVAGAAIAVGSATNDKNLANAAYGLGGLGAGLLLASYSRDNEREADMLGMEYMVRQNLNPKGMIGLMDILRSMNKHKPSTMQVMFSTHPMSDERYATAVNRAKKNYPKSSKNMSMGRQRYMDHTAGIRRLAPAIRSMQKGDELMAKKKYKTAEAHYAKALKVAPRDYAGNLMMAKCQLAQKKTDKAARYANKAKSIKPGEGQAVHMSGIAKLIKKNYGGAYQEFASYEKLLPGNPNTLFLAAVSLDGMGRRDPAAKRYRKYLDYDQKSEQAKHAYNRLVKWGYIKPQQQQQRRR